MSEEEIIDDESVFEPQFEEKIKNEEIKTTRFTDSLYFTLLSVGMIAIVFLMMQGLRENIFSEMTDMYINSGWNQINVILVYILFYKLWNFLIFISVSIMINVILAKVLNVQVGRVLILTIMCLLVSILGYHIINYVIIRYTDPLQMENLSLLDFLLELLTELSEYAFNYTEISDFSLDKVFSSVFSSENAGIFDLFFRLIYYFMFIDDPSILNYFALYMVGSGTAISWIPFKYDFFIIAGAYILLFMIIYPFFVDSCSCTPPEYLTELKLPTDVESETISEIGIEEEEKETI